MLETIFGSVLGVTVTTGTLVGIAYIFGQKILTLLYDAIKDKISADIERSNEQFKNVLDQKIKRLEIQLQKSMDQYNIEVKKYEEIIKKLHLCDDSIRNMYNISLMNNKSEQTQKMNELREQVSNAAKALKKEFEEAGPFIPEEIYNIGITYYSHIEELEKIHRRNIFGIQHGNDNDKMRAEDLIQKIKTEKLSIHHSIRSRLQKLGEIEEET